MKFICYNNYMKQLNEEKFIEFLKTLTPSQLNDFNEKVKSYSLALKLNEYLTDEIVMLLKQDFPQLNAFL